MWLHGRFTVVWEDLADVFRYQYGDSLYSRGSRTVHDALFHHHGPDQFADL